MTHNINHINNLQNKNNNLDYYPDSARFVIKNDNSQELELVFKIDRQVILDCKWRSKNLKDAEPSCSFLSEYIVGLTINEALLINNRVLPEELSDFDCSPFLQAMQKALMLYSKKPAIS
ncbi:MAG: hypothetical protein GY730_00855 [bacterium]|nr:hypothetical protein [bacterium]